MLGMSMTTVGLSHYLMVSLVMLCLGLFCVLTRRNAIGVLMGIELILNSAGINFVAVSRYGSAGFDGQVVAVFIVVLAAAESAIGLAVVLGIYRRMRAIDTSRLTTLQG